MLDCGYLLTSCRSLQVAVNGQLIQPNLDVGTDIMQAFFSWIHQWDDGEWLTASEQQVFDTIRICSNSSTETVIVQRIVIWHFNS